VFGIAYVKQLRGAQGPAKVRRAGLPMSSAIKSTAPRARDELLLGSDHDAVRYARDPKGKRDFHESS